MWFKMSLELLHCAAMREIDTSFFHGDHSQPARKMAFIDLLAITATGAAQDLQGPDDIARMTMISQKQAKIVWEVCQRHGVLRQTDNGYSARAWMIERGVLGGNSKEQKTSKMEW